MKRKTISKRTGLAVAAVLTSFSLVHNADALVLAYEQDPDGPGPLTIGSPYLGPVQFFFEGLDAGTGYLPFGPNGTTVGSPNPATGIPIMDALVPAPVPGFKVGQAPGSIGSEDTWGIGFVSRIVDPATNANVWTPLGKNAQIKGMFYGATDFYARQENPSTQTIASVGLTIDLYEQPGFAPIPNFAGTNPNQRLAIDQYPNFTSPPEANPLLARFNTVSGFLDAGAGITNTELLSIFVNSSGGQGSSQGFLSVVPGMGSGSTFDNNGFTANFGNNTADARFVFSTQTLPSANPWTVSVSGPVDTTVIPEPTTALAGIACMVPLLRTFLGRRRKSLVSA